MADSIHERLIPLRVIGDSGVDRIASSRIAVVGAGGTGSHHIEMLARLGVGSLTILDGDIVDKSNLGRQALYTYDDIGEPKAHRAAEAAKAINPALSVKGHFTDLKPSTLDILDGVDIILDGTDNMHTRHLINEYAVENDVPWIYCGAIATEYMAMPVVPGQGPCLRCMVPAAAASPPTCAEVGIMEPAVAAASAVAVTMAVRVIVDGPSNILDPKGRSHLVHGDVWNRSQEVVLVGRDGDCPVCVAGKRPVTNSSGPRVRTLCGGGFEVVVPGTIDLSKLCKRYSAMEFIGPVARMSLDGAALTIFSSGRIRVSGVVDEKAALRVVRETLGY